MESHHFKRSENHKRFISFILVVALLLTVCLGCSKKEDTAAPTTEETFSLPDLTSDTLQVGYGRADITPKDCVPLRGYNNSSKRQSFCKRNR